MQQLNATLKGSSVAALDFVVRANQSAIFNTKLEFTVTVRDFLGGIAYGKLSVVRRESKLPTVQLSEVQITAKPSQEISVEGNNDL